MAYDEQLAQRLARALASRKGISETRMFGSLCFMLNGNMLCGIARDQLMFRVGKEQHAAALARPGARPMDITGRPMSGFVFVDPAACNTRQLNAWITLAEGYVGELPARKPAGKKTSTKRR